jgi:hypothetical protein
VEIAVTTMPLAYKKILGRSCVVSAIAVDRNRFGQLRFERFGRRLADVWMKFG